MYTVRRRVTIPLAIVAALAVTPVLAGCLGNPVEGIINGAVEKATGGDVSLGGKLPDGWPSEVPVIEGDILFGAGSSASGSEGWVVTIASKAADPLEDAKAKLIAAGFTEDANVANGQAGLVAVKNDNYGVLVAGSKDGILYTVTPITP
ncbi:hypothetical protein [Luethyella okanaganae]|uniref:Lipoprotein n=1 Tax=Luethyella okanaganae TaxID=69372 RepID=A0ABW1VAD8_9MICO